MMAAVLAVAATATALSTTGGPASASTGAGAGGAVGAVYVASNSYAGNTIVTLPRYADGSLGAVAATTATGGRGSGPGQVPLVVNDPLGSQGSLIADPSGHFLFAVNAGSDSVSAFTVGTNGSLKLASTVSSGGAYPVSLTYFRNTLYVLNAVGDSVSGFVVSPRGYLVRLQTCALPALPAGGDPLDEYPATATSSAQPVGTQMPGQVGFSPDGQFLVVTSKEGPVLNGFPFGATSGPGEIHVYQVNPISHLVTNCGSPHTYTLPYNVDDSGLQHGKFPFSFTWTSQGDLLLTEVFGESSVPDAGYDNLSAIGSFALSASGDLSPIATVADTSPVPCWIVRSGANVLVANFLGNDVTSYRVDSSGGLTPPGGIATPLAGGTYSIDMATSPDGQFLYELAPGSATAQVFPFAVGSTGVLSALAPVNDGLGAGSGQQGIATVTFP